VLERARRRRREVLEEEKGKSLSTTVKFRKAIIAKTASSPRTVGHLGGEKKKTKTHLSEACAVSCRKPSIHGEAGVDPRKRNSREGIRKDSVLR